MQDSADEEEDWGILHCPACDKISIARYPTQIFCNADCQNKGWVWFQDTRHTDLSYIFERPISVISRWEAEDDDFAPPSEDSSAQ